MDKGITKKPVTDEYGHGSFEVTCVIGTVNIDPSGQLPADVVAFGLIGEHRAPGQYVFPHDDGRMIHVTVEYV